MKEQMTRTEELVWEYLRTHKTPVAAGTLAKRFILSQSRISSILRMFEDNGMAEAVNIGRHKFYKIKSQESKA